MTSSLPFCLLGLGNPGRQYERTRHNVGFDAVDSIAELTGSRFRKVLLRPLIVGTHTPESAVFCNRFIFAKPLTYMNRSGHVLPYLVKKYKLSPSRICVVTDNMDLPPGEIRMKMRGGSSRHNGLKSVTEALGTSEFPRIYLGIGRPERPDAVVDHVLGMFSESDRTATRAAIERLSDIFQSYTFESVDQLIALVNERRRAAQDG